MREGEFVAIRVGIKLAMASILKEILEANKIDVAVENMGEAQFGESMVQISVKNQDFERALEILEARTAMGAKESLRFIFISHTAPDAPFIRREIMPVIQKHYLNAMLLNYTSYDHEKLYKSRILIALASSGWFLLVLLQNATQSKWVRFEVDWAMGHRAEKRIIPIMIEECDASILHGRLKERQFIDFCRDPAQGRQQLSEWLPVIDDLSYYLE